MTGGNGGNGNNHDHRIESLNNEYGETWQDFRFRTTVELTILTIFFPTMGAFLGIYHYGDDIVKQGILFTGIIFTIGVLSLLLGERRAWVADIVRLKQLEYILSQEKISWDDQRTKMIRHRCYHELYQSKRYLISWQGSFAWYLFMVTLLGSVFGGLLLIELYRYNNKLVGNLFTVGTIITFLILIVFIQYIILYTLRKDTDEKEPWDICPLNEKEK